MFANDPIRSSPQFPRIPLAGGWEIETWYNRSEMSWVTVLRDDKRNQVGESYYDGHSDSVPSSRQSMVDRHRNEYPRSEET